MYFIFTVQVEVERESGKFASRDELLEKIAEALTNCDEQQWDTDDGATYNTVTWEVEHDDAAIAAMDKAAKARRRERRKAKQVCMIPDCGCSGQAHA